MNSVRTRDAQQQWARTSLSESRQQLELDKKEGEEALLEKEREKQLEFEKESWK